MTRTKIEWCDYTINPVKGKCPMGCSYCYARRMYDRFKWNPEIRWYPPAFDLLDKLKKPSRIFVGSTMELFHPSLPENWMEYNLGIVKKYPQHTFIFLTKCPENLHRWSPFPANAYVGVSVTNQGQYEKAIFYLKDVEAKVKFLSFEPLLERIPLHFADYICEDVRGINLVIIGQQTPPSKKTEPKAEWIKEIVEACDEAGIPVFLKDNLISPSLLNANTTDWAFGRLHHNWHRIRQDFPE